MDSSKRATFVKRVKMAKGGQVRKKYALGGPTQLTNANGTQASGPLSPGGQFQNIGSSIGIAPDSGVGKLAGGVASLNPLNTQNQFTATAAPLQAGTNRDQLDAAYGQAQSGLAQQQDFYNQLAGQNGIGNQSQVYGQLQDIAAGRGPNPAQAMLNQQTGQNVANQAALMAGQRGAGSNVGLMARQAAQQGAATQQQAVGQGATMEANQRMHAIDAAGNIAGQQVNQQGQALTGYNTAAQNEQNTLQGANSNFNNAQVGMQSNLNNVNGQISQGNQAANNGMMGGIMNGASSMLSSIFAKGGFVGPHGKNVVAVTLSPKGITHHFDDGGSVDFGNVGYTAPAAESSPNIGSMAATDEGSEFKQDSKGGGGGGGGGGGLMALAALADGGEVNFGKAEYTAPAAIGAPNIGSMAATDEGSAFKQSGDGKSDKKKKDQGASAQPASLAGGSDMPIYAAKGGMPGPYKSHVANFLAAGGSTEKVPAMVSPGEVYLSPEAVHKVVAEGANPLKVGEKIKGQAKVKGDSLKNDTVPRTLEEGGVVIPRHITTHKMAAEKAELFVHRTLAKKRMH